MTTSPILKISSLNLNIETNKLLNNFSLEINKGERVAITGPSGCGKSTLLKSIIANKFPQGSLFKTFEKSISNKVAFVPQNNGLLPWFSLNKIFSIFSRDKFLENDIVEKFGMQNLLNSFPNQLSGGEYQRSLLATALVSKPNFLLADEPITELDLSNKWRLLEYLSKYLSQNQAALLLVSHDPDTLLYLSDKIIVLSDKPSNIITEIKLTSVHPRNIDYLTSVEFNNAKKILLEKVQSET